MGNPEATQDVAAAGTFTGTAGDKYTGLDRFGRIADQRWAKGAGGTGAIVAQNAYAYDRHGNRLSDSIYGTLLARYQDDALNRRITEQVGTPAAPNADLAPVRDLFYSDQWQILEERVRTTPGVVAATADTRYVWSPVYVDALIARDRNADGNGSTGTNGLEQRVYALQDANWNTHAIVAASGVPGYSTGQVINRFIYTPFGTHEVLNDAYWAAAPAIPWDRLFQGHEYTDVTKLTHMRNRDYSATLGRFVQRDPIGFAAGDNNLYRFVGNGPTGSTDPSGLAEVSDDEWLDEHWHDIDPDTDMTYGEMAAAGVFPWSPVPETASQPPSPAYDEFGLPTSGRTRVGDTRNVDGQTMHEGLDTAKREAEQLCKDVATNTVNELGTLACPGPFDDRFIDAYRARNAAKAAKGITHGLEYDPRVFARALEDPVGHGFPLLLDDAILSVKGVPVNDGVGYAVRGFHDGKEVIYNMVVKDGVIVHRDFVSTRKWAQRSKSFGFNIDLNDLPTGVIE